jgi:hypothetical protein
MSKRAILWGHPLPPPGFSLATKVLRVGSETVPIVFHQA